MAATAAASVLSTGHLQHTQTEEPRIETASEMANPKAILDSWPPHLLFGYTLADDWALSNMANGAQRRRNSTPALALDDAPPATAVASTTMLTRRPSLGDASSQTLREEFLESIRPPPPKMVQCNICLEEHPESKPNELGTMIVQPCSRCESLVCSGCLQGMFVGATKDMSRMPPRCCAQIQLHHARPHLQPDEVIEYKLRFEEWSTPRPFYCPIPTCSVFISNRVLPQTPPRLQKQETAATDGDGKKNNKKRKDSGTASPGANVFACPGCSGDICVDCRQVAHPGNMCAALDMGLDLQTAALLKKWGYTRCPKCSHGVKRMYGCSQMMCRCGASFCWGCRLPYDQCGGCSPDDESEVGYDESDRDSETGDDADNEDRSQDPEATVTAEVEAPTSQNEESINFDSRARRNWRALDLGGEPSSRFADHAWDCSHKFHAFPDTAPPQGKPRLCAQDLECIKCWVNMEPMYHANDGDGDDERKKKKRRKEEEERTSEFPDARECMDCALLVCRRCEEVIEEARRALESDEGGSDSESNNGDDDAGGDTGGNSESIDPPMSLP